MPRPRPPHLLRETTRHGKSVWYVRVDKGPRIRLRSAYGTPEFQNEYDAALRGERPAKRGSGRVGSLLWLIERYREAPAWTGLSMATRRQRENILRQIIESAGSEPYTAIGQKEISAGRDRRGQTPFQARHFLDTMRGLFDWAVEAEYRKDNPARKVKYPELPDSRGFATWTEDDIAAFERRWPLGTRQRVWLAVLLYTGLRRGDTVRLGRQHVEGDDKAPLSNRLMTIHTEKSGEIVEVAIVIRPPLAEALAAGPTSELAFICGANGGPLTKESFGNEFSAACREAGVRKSAHGLRKAAAIRAAYHGATVPQLNAMFGWSGTKMAMLYIAAAERRRLAIQGAGLMNDTGTSIPAPMQKVRAAEQN